VSNSEAPQSFFWQVVMLVVAFSNLIRWPVAAFVYFAPAVAWLWVGNVFWGILWLLILGEIAAGIAMLVTAVPFFILGAALASVLVALRRLWRMERAAIRSLPFEIRKRTIVGPAPPAQPEWGQHPPTGEQVEEVVDERGHQASPPGGEEQPGRDVDEGQPTPQEQWQEFLRRKKGRSEERKPPP
jgi:hypothetical protein